jgi:hypothetical protein
MKNKYKFKWFVVAEILKSKFVDRGIGLPRKYGSLFVLGCELSVASNTFDNIPIEDSNNNCSGKCCIVSHSL